MLYNLKHPGFGWSCGGSGGNRAYLLTATYWLHSPVPDVEPKGEAVNLAVCSTPYLCSLALDEDCKKVTDLSCQLLLVTSLTPHSNVFLKMNKVFSGFDLLSTRQWLFLGPNTVLSSNVVSHCGKKSDNGVSTLLHQNKVATKWKHCENGDVTTLRNKNKQQASGLATRITKMAVTGVVIYWFNNCMQYYY